MKDENEELRVKNEERRVAGARAHLTQLTQLTYLTRLTRSARLASTPHRSSFVSGPVISPPQGRIPCYAVSARGNHAISTGRRSSTTCRESLTTCRESSTTCRESSTTCREGSITCRESLTTGRRSSTSCRGSLMTCCGTSRGGCGISAYVRETLGEGRGMSTMNQGEARSQPRGDARGEDWERGGRKGLGDCR